MNLPVWRNSIEELMPLMHVEASEIPMLFINRTLHRLAKAVLMMQGPLWRTNARRDGDPSESGLAEQERAPVGERTNKHVGSKVPSLFQKMAHLEAAGMLINRIQRNVDKL